MELCSRSNGGTIQRKRSSGIQEYQCFESCNPEKEKYQRHHTPQCGCFKHRALVPNHFFCKSAQFCGTVSNWCEQFGLTEEEKGQEKQQESVTKGVLTSVKSQEVKLLVSSPRLVFGKSLRENIRDFESLSETIRSSRVCELASFWHRVSAGMSFKTRPDEDDGFWADHSIMPGIHAFSTKPTIQSLCSNSWRNNYWTSH